MRVRPFGSCWPYVCAASHRGAVWTAGPLNRSMFAGEQGMEHTETCRKGAASLACRPSKAEGKPGRAGPTPHFSSYRSEGDQHGLVLHRRKGLGANLFPSNRGCWKRIPSALHDLAHLREPPAGAGHPPATTPRRFEVGYTVKVHFQLMSVHGASVFLHADQNNPRHWTNTVQPKEFSIFGFRSIQALELVEFGALPYYGITK